jgi:acyl CoA:acetate/3-ketoacid CoA transferase alpha subunit
MTFLTEPALSSFARPAGMGLGAVFTPTGFGTLLAEGKETREIDGKDYVLEYPIKNVLRV